MILERSLAMTVQNRLDARTFSRKWKQKSRGSFGTRLLAMETFRRSLKRAKIVARSSRGPHFMAW